MEAMSVMRALPDVHDVRADRVGGDLGVLERTAELAVLRDAATRAAGGRGAVVVIEAAAGLGTTTLLEHAARMAASAGCEVRHAASGPLEREFPYGVVRALLEAALRAAPEDERERLLHGPAADAARLLLGLAAPTGDAITAVAHSVFWLVSELAAAVPLTLIVDDAQWADRASLEVLTYVARRIEGLPVLIAVGARADDPGAPSDLLSLLGGVRAATVLRPRPLSVWGAIALIRRHAPDAPARLCRDCLRTVGGSPWLLDELGRLIGSRQPEGQTPGEYEPSAVARGVVRRRLAELTPPARAVAAALAIAGPGAAAHIVAELAGVEMAELTPARDALRAAGLLSPGRADFAHGLIATAVVEDLAGTERERLHREAARVLSGFGASSAVIAGHLLECGPSGDPVLTRLLDAAAGDAADRGAPAAAARYLERALLERADGDDRGAMLARLAATMFDAGVPGVRRRLHEALRESTDRKTRLDVLARLASTELLAGGDARLAGLLADEPDDPGTRAAIGVTTLDALAVAVDGRPERARRLTALADVADGSSALARAVVAHQAWAELELGAARADVCAGLALDALDGDRLLRQADRRAGYHLAVRTLVLSDRHDEARAAIGALRAEAARRGSAPLRAAADVYSAELALRAGEPREAERHARAALETGEAEIGAVTGAAVAVLVAALADRGALEEALALLRTRGMEGPLGDSAWELDVLHARARLWLELGDYERALADASEAGVRQMRRGRPNPTWMAWRSTAALALAHLGRRDEAVVLADEEIARAERFGAPVPLLLALHARAVAEPEDEQRIALCRRALLVAEGASTVLDTVRVRLVLGSTLARLGSRVEAREQLRPALAEADEAGAVPLAERARRELVATGLRPRRAALRGACALTPRQRQICALAAAGKGNREIAHALFLSIKTVETHLAAGYRKLGINSRDDLGMALEAC